MPPRGKFIAIEGIDGAGKRTQLELLVKIFPERGIPYQTISFPRYEGFFGRLVARFLNGEFGQLKDVDPHFSALLYAGDRLEAKPELEAALAAGRTILADRYVGSNLAHQAARVPARGQKEFLGWLKQLEYEIYGLPREDLVVYLRMPPAEAKRLVGRKSARGYTQRRRDLLEANLTHLQGAARIYDLLAEEPNWVKIECYEPGGKGVRAPEEIHRDVLAAIESRLAWALPAR